MASSEHGRASHPHSTNKNYAHLVRGSKVEVTCNAEGFKGSWFEATVIKPPGMPNSKFPHKRITLVEYSNLLNDDGSLLLRERVDATLVRPVPPITEEDGGFKVGDMVDTFEKDGWWAGVVDRVVMGEGEEVRYVVRFADPVHEIEFAKDSLRLHLDWINGKWFRFLNGKRQELVVKEDGRVTLATNSSRSDSKEHQLILNPAPMGCDPECCIGMMPSVNKLSTPLNRMQLPSLPSSCRQDTIDLEFPISSFIHSPPAKKLKRTCVEEPLVHPNSKPAELSNPLRDCQNKGSGYHVTSPSHGEHNTHVRAKRSKRRAGRSKDIPNALVSVEVSEADDVQKDLSLEEQLTEAVGTELATVKQGGAPEADTAAHNSSMQELAIVAVGIELNSEEQGHSDLVNERQQPATNDISVIGPSLPFLRTSPVWEAVESLKIYRKFPQQPHFLPLLDARERFREGLAIAKMVTFASIAENAINLSIDDDIGSFTDCLETLQSLESYGFDTETLQSRLVKLMSLKEMQQKIDDEKSEIKGRVSELKHEIVEVKEEICETVSKIKFYQDKLKSALVKEEEKDLKVLALETSMDVLDTVICSARLDFEDSSNAW